MTSTSPKRKRIVLDDGPFSDDEGARELDNFLNEILNSTSIRPSTSLFVDMTDHTGITGSALRVELRRCHDPVVHRVEPNRRIIEGSYLIGLISPEKVPKEGEYFNLRYHTYNGQIDYGEIITSSPVSELLELENYYYYSTSEGDWRLEVLSAGS